MTAPPCTTRRTWHRKEWYSLSERSESAWVSTLRVRGTSFTSFRAGTVGGGCAAALGIVTVVGIDMGTCTKDTMGLGIVVVVHTGTDWGWKMSAIWSGG